MVYRNMLGEPVFYTTPEIQVIPFSTPAVLLSGLTSPEIRLNIFPAVELKLATTSYAFSLVPLLKNSDIAGVTLKSLLLVQLRQTETEVIAEAWLEGIYEYGTGKEEAEALIDLIVSMREYLDALEIREEQLGTSAQQELKTLRELIKR